jgi:hypothetical protein
MSFFYVEETYCDIRLVSLDSFGCVAAFYSYSAISGSADFYRDVVRMAGVVFLCMFDLPQPIILNKFGILALWHSGKSEM